MISEPAESASAAQPVDKDFPWTLAGGAAALLIASGAALAFARRRRRDETAPSGISAARQSHAVRPDLAPVPTAPRVDAQHQTPIFAAAPLGSIGRHEAMAMAGPTPDNPFATLKKRLKRARFYDRRERLAHDGMLTDQMDRQRAPVSAWEVSQRPMPADANRETQEVHRPRPARGLFTNRPGFAGS